MTPEFKEVLYDFRKNRMTEKILLIMISMLMIHSGSQKFWTKTWLLFSGLTSCYCRQVGVWLARSLVFGMYIVYLC